MLSVLWIPWRGALVSLIVLSGLCVDAGAQERRASVAQLARDADVVAVGKVKSMKSEWAEKGSRIVTRVTLAVSEYIKGGDGAGSDVTIETLGGEIGDVGELYTHVATFRQNEEVVVFLEKAPEGRWQVAGGTQGKYNVEKDPVSGRRVVAGKEPLEEFTISVRKAAQN